MVNPSAVCRTTTMSQACRKTFATVSRPAQSPLAAQSPTRPPVTPVTATAIPRPTAAYDRSSPESIQAKKIELNEDEEEWRRQLRNVRRWRKNYEETKQQFANVRPPSSNESSSSSSSSSTTSKLHDLSSNILSALVASGASLGHPPSALNPNYTPYIYGTRADLSIIDLEQSVPLLRKAANVVREVVENDGIVLFVGTREGHRDMCLKAADRLDRNGFAVAGTKWMSGTLTNALSFFGMRPIRSRSHLPDLVVILNPSENLGLVRECTTSNVPTIGIVDTNADPRMVTYAIPANMELESQALRFVAETGPLRIAAHFTNQLVCIAL